MTNENKRIAKELVIEYLLRLSKYLTMSESVQNEQLDEVREKTFKLLEQDFL